MKQPFAAARARGSLRSAIQFSEGVAGDGAQVFAAAEQLGLEGIVSKRTGSRYASGSTRDWLKTKAIVEAEVIVVGAEPNSGGPRFALIARETGEGLRLCRQRVASRARSRKVTTSAVH